MTPRTFLRRLTEGEKSWLANANSSSPTLEEGKQVVLGIRPERFVVGAAANAVDSHLKAKVDVYESLGAENAAAVDLDVPESILGRAGAVTEAVRAKLGDNADMWMNQAHSRFV